MSQGTAMTKLACLLLCQVMLVGAPTAVHAEDADASPQDAAAPAADSTAPAPPPPPASARDDSGIAGYFASWFTRVHAAQASQPHWITPIATVTPRLEEEFRYDQLWETMGSGGRLDSYDGGKGLELIPTTTNEIIFNLPPYQQRYVKKPAKGFNDWPFLLIKQRLVSANEQNGNYIVSAFFSVQAPTGIKAFTNDAWVITPTLAAGKGWGRFDIQGTVGVPIPLEHQSAIGTQVVTNVALQYHLGEFFWPELEFNSTYWANGPRGGKTQIFVTPGLVLGRFPLGSGLKGIIGVGYQVAVSPKLNLTPALTPTYDHAWILTARVTF
jgi:hypothetical protein